MSSARPEPDENGMIPCICCDFKGRRKDTQTGEKYICNFCHGSKRRLAPPGYSNAPETPQVPVRPPLEGEEIIISGFVYTLVGE